MPVAVLRCAGGPGRSVADLIAQGTPISSRDCSSPLPPEPGAGPREFGIGEEQSRLPVDGGLLAVRSQNMPHAPGVKIHVAHT